MNEKSISIAFLIAAAISMTGLIITDGIFFLLTNIGVLAGMISYETVERKLEVYDV